jgi:hypothetical protein
MLSDHNFMVYTSSSLLLFHNLINVDFQLCRSHIVK